ncbi:hypothetical protein EC991_005677 [Linnemannia zychae]|nr:hypothetical protein EC991_005677 [Linnemannia zychae]
MLESNHNTAIEHTWIHNHPWTAFALHMQLGYGLKALLNQRRQLDLEQERQQEYMRQQGYHQPLMDNKDLLPSPVMLTSLKEGFKTEAEQLRLRSRVSTWPRFLVAIWFLWLAIKGVNHFLHLSEHRSGQEIIQLTFSLAQGVAGLYILYRKSLALTQWLFYSICASTVYQAFTISRDIWKTDYKQSWMDYYSGVDEDEFEGISAFKDMADNLTPGEVVCIRIMFILGVTLFFVSRVWVAWRLVTDLKERDARIARAKEIQGRVGAEKVIVG